MILYHGSNIIVKEPKIITSDLGKDFGFAFYLTPIKEQAERMALRKTRIAKTGSPIVSVFRWNENTRDYKYKKFNNADIDWMNLVIKCRQDLKFKHNFDIIEGKIADDRVGMTISLVAEGFLSKEEALKQLKYQKINSQIAFCTNKSLMSLKFIKSYRTKYEK